MSEERARVTERRKLSEVQTAEKTRGRKKERAWRYSVNKNTTDTSTAPTPHQQYQGHHLCQCQC
ncbi:hypothetical protein BDQ17DRAFT_1379800 [Cyathus striatus]|nr:hypothetical protein BDQ17DRAFT_1379800 [Cyathus striatus]